MTHTIVGPCHPHLLDPSKLVDSQGTPIIEIIYTQNNVELEQERAKFINECINQCLHYGLPKDALAELTAQYEKSQKSMLRGFKSLITTLRKLKKTPNTTDETINLLNNGIKAGKKTLDKLSR
jgi:hypothetical protein